MEKERVVDGLAATRKQRRAVILFLVVFVLTPVVLVLSCVSYLKSQIIYSNKPSNTVFRMLFHEPVPPTVTGLRYSGQLAGFIYMRFHVKDPAVFVAQLKANPHNVIEPAPGNPIPQSAKSYDKDIGWSDARRVRAPVIYQFNAEPAYPGWIGEIIIDKRTNEVFVQGGTM